MIFKTVEFSLRQRTLVVLATFVLVVGGCWSALRLPIDSVPDITSPQVLVNTPVPALAPEEIEKLVTLPLEGEMAGLPGMIELRTLSKFGLSQIRMTFEDNVDIYRTRQLVSERLLHAAEKLPAGLQPQLAPITTALGEIFYYQVRFKADVTNSPYQALNPTEQLQSLKQLQEYVISPFLRTTPGIAEINTSGGYERQIVVMPDAALLASAGLTIEDLSRLIGENTQNVGGGLIELGGEQIVIRGNNRVTTTEEIASIPLKFGAAIEPVLVRDVAEVGIGSDFRTGASTVDGEEAVVGGALMIAGGNSRVVAQTVAERLHLLQDKLPPEVEVRPLYNRTDLVNRTLRTPRRGGSLRHARKFSRRMHRRTRHSTFNAVRAHRHGGESRVRQLDESRRH
jgi:cobalt-zinc-cadmium resistance protein CzcA